MNQKVSREKFEKVFKSVNGSMALSDAELNDEEKELVYKKLNGELSDEDFTNTILK